MKKVIICIFLIVSVILSIFIVKYNQKLQTLQNTKKFNSGFEDYLNRQINGVDLTTIINKAIENNTSFEIEKNKNGTYKNNNETSIEILIKPTKERKLLSNGSF